MKILQSLFHVSISLGLVQFTDRMMGHAVRLRNPDTLIKSMLILQNTKVVV